MSKIVFISGSSLGIGRATAFRFAKEGYNIVLTYRVHKQEAEAAARECQKLGARQTHIVELDLSSDESIKRAAQSAIQKFGKIDVLINNAGIYEGGLLPEQSFELIHRQIVTNLEGQIKLTHELINSVIEAVIFVSSRLGIVGKKKASVYSATKWGLRGFAKSVALERKDLLVLAVLPGLTATSMGNNEGMPAEKVAGVIYKGSRGDFHLKSGSDVLVRYYVLGPWGRVIFMIKELIKKFIGR